MSDHDFDARSRSFGAAADLYDRIRPDYPPAALRWILAAVRRESDGPLRVLDLGAGTGILTRQLVALGHRVEAVEPDDGMRAKLAATTPEAVALPGSAESIPVPDDTFDAVLSGQAYHWFDRARAHPEITRVIRPGGVFGPLWNIRDQSVPWTVAYSKVIKGEEDTPGIHAGQLRDADFGSGFGPVEEREFPHEKAQSPAGLEELMKSRSYYLTADPDQQHTLTASLRDLLNTHPDLAGRTEFAMSYRTFAYRAVRVGGQG